MNDATAIRTAIRQQLLSDQFLGVDSVPVPAAILNVQAYKSRRPTHAETPVRAKRTGETPPTEKAQRLSVLNESHVKSCTKCGLAAGRTQTVFGQGNPAARLVFVGEAPGFEEDRKGLAFVGPAGQLLTRMIEAMGIGRDEVFICNVLKCRPPGNRDPLSDEILACSPYLREQINIIRPEVMVSLGAPASKTLLNTAESIGRLRGRFHDFYFSGVQHEGESIPLMPTYHPAYLLRNPEDKKKTWEDLQKVMAFLGLPLPERRDGK